ncbi:M48 family metallopeptidase [Flavobacterium sp. ST-75]|uniref:M48 family metallopeptidase n=1 Tax=Flavobacterium rhizophilum TaxID=3163296 RepID=A0ABW8YGB1_9FLAO
MKHSLLLFFFFSFFYAAGQNSFSPLDTLSHTCAAKLKVEYVKKFKNINNNREYETSAQKNVIKEIYGGLQEDFIEKIDNNNFICDSELNSYLNGLMNEILTSNSIDKDIYRILLSKDPDVNAYNTGDGTVVVNYGLFLAVDNEDELVFVICHEVGHQFLDHLKKDVEAYARLSTSEEMIKKTKEIKKQKYGKASMATNLLKNIRYQSYSERREKEIEADSIGLVFYRQTKRSPAAAISLLQKLDVSDAEKDSLVVEDYKKIFEKGGFVVKQRYFEQEESLFQTYTKDERFNADSLKSHPDCSTRITLIKDYLDNKFLESSMGSSTGFEEIKRNSVYQNLFNMFSAQDYGISLYEALKLYKYELEDPVLKNIIYLNLVKIYDSRKNYTINRYVPKHDNLRNTKSLNRFISFISNIKMTDLETIINNFKS